jgi:transposase
MKSYRAGTLGDGTGKQVSPEQMEISRLRSELARSKMELEIVKKAAAYFAKESL